MSSGPVIGIRDDVVAVGIGSGIRLRLNGVSAEAAVNQLLAHGRLTLPNTVDLGDALDAMDAQDREWGWLPDRVKRWT